uniref:Uncharacterized protein n=1 Tax=Anopheles culicifacies TaxID=139723 RepID=A0A182MCB5_9DIPT
MGHKGLLGAIQCFLLCWISLLWAATSTRSIRWSIDLIWLVLIWTELKKHAVTCKSPSEDCILSLTKTEERRGDLCCLVETKKIINIISRLQPIGHPQTQIASREIEQSGTMKDNTGGSRQSYRSKE